MTEKTKPPINREDVLRMAQEAGAGRFRRDESAQIVTPEVLERFAAIVAALVAAHEREACAKAAEGFEANRDWVPGSLWGNIRADVAAAIRARGAA